MDMPPTNVRYTDPETSALISRWTWLRERTSNPLVTDAEHDEFDEVHYQLQVHLSTLIAEAETLAADLQADYDLFEQFKDLAVPLPETDGPPLVLPNGPIVRSA